MGATVIHYKIVQPNNNNPSDQNASWMPHGEVSRASPTVRRVWGRTRTYCRDFTSGLGQLKIPQEELEGVFGEKDM